MQFIIGLIAGAGLVTSLVTFLLRLSESEYS